MGIISHLARHRAWTCYHSMPRNSERVKVGRQSLHEVVLLDLAPAPLEYRLHISHKYESCLPDSESLSANGLRAACVAYDPESTQKHYTVPRFQNQSVRYGHELAADHQGCRSLQRRAYFRRRVYVLSSLALPTTFFTRLRCAPYELDYFQCRMGNPATGDRKVGRVLIAS